MLFILHLLHIADSRVDELMKHAVAGNHPSEDVLRTFRLLINSLVACYDATEQG